MTSAPQYSSLPDGTLQRCDGTLVALSLDRFRDEIVCGDSCFICCAQRDEKEFNDEHVIPAWVLRQCDIAQSAITLPNGKPYPYSRYKVPCCVECNAELGDRVETPISRLFKLSYDDFVHALVEESPTRILQLFHWLNLLFLKTHLKDRLLPFHLDNRLSSDKIADHIDWARLHHVHCIARGHFTAAAIDHRTIGSVFVLQAVCKKPLDRFDYGDLVGAQSMMVRINDIALVAVLDDSCACYSAQPQFIKDVKGRLGPLQLREVLGRLAHMNLCLKERPVFHSSIVDGQYCIGVDLPDRVEFIEITPAEVGEVMHAACKSFIAGYPEKERLELETNILSGKWTFLRDADGNFIRQE